MTKSKIDRKEFVKRTAGASLGLFLSNSLVAGSKADARDLASYDIMKEVMKYPKIDAYATSNLSPQNLAVQLDYAERLNIEKLLIAMPMLSREETPEEFKASNDLSIKAMKLYPDRLIGQLTVNPRYGKQALAEIDRCIDKGLWGTRLYNQVKINDPLYYPLIEKFIDLKMIIFMHGESQLGVGGYRMKYDAKKALTTSTPDDFVEAAQRYPEAKFQFAHIGGGGDWEYMCKCFQDYPNIYVDTGGSNNDENMIDFALEYLGEDRLFYGSDSSYFQSVGKILASDITDAQKKKIFYQNYNILLNERSM